MHAIHTKRYALITLMFLVILLAACNATGNTVQNPLPNHDGSSDQNNQPDDERPTIDTDTEPELADHLVDNEERSNQDDQNTSPVDDSTDGIESSADYDHIRSQYDMRAPDAISVLVNKTYGLPDGWEPDDLVKVNIPFVYQDDSVHSLRQIAADALIEMFEASKADGLELAGVSGYRSYAIQKMLYEKYVARDGEEAANKYSAKPGHSEHSTGLAMDVAGISGKCAANNCFADTEEAIWLAEHAHEYGFIIRYPLGKEDITGYQYEPWHLRYVGIELAEILHENEWTMEEFFLPDDTSDTFDTQSGDESSE